MNGKVFLGVDGGGTYTRIAAADESGRILGRVCGDSINFRALGMTLAKSNLKKALVQLEKECDIGEYWQIGIGMSAIDYDPSPDIVNCFCRDLLPVNRVLMKSDAYMALMGMTLGKPGIIIISGTGSMGLGIDKNNSAHYIGGWGYLLGDEGSAYYIAVQGIKAALNDFEGLGPKTALKEELSDYFNIEDHRDLISRIYDPHAKGSDIAGFAKRVDNCADEGDEAAISILDSSIKVLVEYAGRLLNILGVPGCPVAMYGGVLKNNKRIAKGFSSKVQQAFPDAKIGFPDYPAEIGAIFSVLSLNKTEISSKMLINFKA